MKNILYLGSKSASRQSLLRDMCVSFVVVDQDANEIISGAELSFHDLLASIALQKMEHVVMHVGKKGEVAFVLTADTMCQDAHGVVHGKPLDKADAIKKIQALRGTGVVGTAFCLDKKIFDGAAWVVEQRIVEYVESRYEYDMPDGWIEWYLERTPNYLQISGAITIESHGAQFLKSINGSYTTIVGLPVFEVRQALEKVGFYTPNSDR